MYISRVLLNVEKFPFFNHLNLDVGTRIVKNPVNLVWPDFFIHSCLKNTLMAGENIAMNVNDTKTITLPGGGTTGYSWSFKAVPDGVVKVSPIAKTAAGSKGPVGGTNDDIFSITAVAKGSATVTFNFGRNWEDKEPKKTNIYQIKVE